MTTVALKPQKLGFRIQEGWSTFIFLALALIMVTWSINEAGYSESLNHLVFVTVGAIVAGIFLAKSRFPWFLTHAFAVVYGIAWNAYVISFQLPDTFTARDRLLELGYRIGFWFQQAVLGGEVGTDPLMFTVVMSILFWLMSYVAMWFSFRAHNVWAALLPSGITLLFNLYYGPDRISFILAPYLLFIFLFVARLNLYLQETRWKQNRVRYDPELVYTFLRYGALLSIVTIAIAWVVPAAASSERAEVFFSRFSEPWEQVKNEWIRLFSTLQSNRVEPTYGTFGDTLSLGGPVALSNATLMDVRAPAGRYWKAAVYDEYTGTGWVTNESDTLFVDSGELPGEPLSYEARRTVTQTFILYMPGTTQIYALAQPERFSLPIKVGVSLAQVSGAEPQIESVLTVDSRYRFESGDSYMVISSLAAVEEDAMRQAGSDYPAWAQRYLQLPDDLPQRVRDLALEVTEPYDNDYDKAMALQGFLREYEYNEQIQEPPVAVDRVDYFLFEMKEGYCNYYASALAVMARAVGIPARVVAGYAQGEWDRDAEAYRVREYDSHAWVEVFLPRFGWIDFEPTASEPEIVRPRRIQPGDSALSGQENPYWEDYLREQELGTGGPFDRELFERMLAEQRRQERIRTWARIGGVLGVSLVIILIAWWFGRRQMNELRAAQIYYERMVRRGDWWGCKMRLYDTPNEYADRLSDSLADPDGDKLVHRITDAYVGERFGRKNPGRYQPDFAWRDLRSKLTRWGIKRAWRRLWGMS